MLEKMGRDAESDPCRATGDDVYLVKVRCLAPCCF